MKYKFTIIFFILLSPSIMFAQISSDSLQKQMLDKTPRWLSGPVIQVVEKIELFRKEHIKNFSEKKEELSNNIRKIEKLTPEERSKEWFVYLYFFAVSLSKFIFESQLLFYAIILVLIAVIARVIYTKVF